MIPLPDLPRWQQYLLLVGALLAGYACVGLRWSGLGHWPSLVPLCLPFLLWWPLPTTFEQRFYWWLMLGLLVSINLGFLYTVAA